MESIDVIFPWDMFVLHDRITVKLLIAYEEYPSVLDIEDGDAEGPYKMAL